MATIARYIGPKMPIVIANEPLPTHLKSGEVLLKMVMATVCGSDIHTVDGRRPAPLNITMGHEGVGKILKTERSGWNVGDVVTWSIADSCGKCPSCTTYNLPQKCERLFKYGHDGFGLSGAYGTHILIRPGTSLHHIPEGTDLRLAASANCALATAVHSIDTLPTAGSSLILGAGLIGLFTAYLLRNEGWSVDLVESEVARREFAIAKGFSVPNSLKSSYDLIIEDSGNPSAMNHSWKLLRKGGQMRLVGLTHPDSVMDCTAENMIRNCWTVIGYHNYAPWHLERAVLEAKGFQSIVDPSEIFGKPFDLLQINEALEAGRSKAVVRAAIRF